LNGVGNTLDDNGIIGALVEKFPCSLQVSSNTNSSSNSDFVSWEGILRFVDSSVGFCHIIFG